MAQVTSGLDRPHVGAGSTPAGLGALDSPPDLVGVLFRVLRNLRRVTAGAAVDGPAAHLLQTLCARGSCRLSDLASEVGLDASTVSRHVRSLEEAGYIARTEHPGDRRASLLTLTPAGSDALKVAVEHRRAVLDDALRSWSSTDRTQLTSLLGRLADDLAQQPGQQPQQSQRSTQHSTTETS